MRSKKGPSVVAGAVSVAPEEADGIVADDPSTHKVRLLWGEARIRIQPPRHARLATAVGAWAEPAERSGLVRTGMPVGPVNLKALFGSEYS